jgi:transposase
MYITMKIDVVSLPDNADDLKEIIKSLSSSYKDMEEEKQSRIDFLEERIRLLQNELFGRKTEKPPRIDDKQLPLFHEDLLEAIEETESEQVTVPQHTRRKRGRKPLPENLPRVEVLVDIKDEEKICGCGHELSPIGTESCEKLEIIPAKVFVIRYIRPKYACKVCEGVEDDGPTVKIAPLAPQIIDKSIATPGLLAHIITSKFEYALPFYRQEKILKQMGIELPRSSLCGWAIKVAEKIEPLMSLLHDEIRSGPLINIDETPVQVLNEPGRPNTSKSYMWVYRGGDPDHPVIIFQYHPSRSGQVPLSFLDGYQGYVQTDGYNGYDALGRQSGVELVGCWAHARRKFVKVINAKSNKSKKGLADEAIDYIGRLYLIEKQAKEHRLEPEEIYHLRQQKAKPILDQFHKWLLEKSAATPPKGLLGKAINYSLKYWDRLARYTEDGLLKPDNNLAENAIRPFVIGRKNWLFSGSPDGAQASSDLYSLVETAKSNSLNPYEYFRFLLEKLPCAETTEDFKKLLPQNIDPADLKFEYPDV